MFHQRRAPGGRRLGNFGDFGDEPVAASRQRHDEARIAGGVAERTPQREDRLVEVVLFDDGLRPDRLHELFFADVLVAVLDQEHQGIEGARGELEKLVLRAMQLPPENVQPKTVEAIFPLQVS